MTRKAAQKIGWNFGTTSAPTSYVFDGSPVVNPATARAEKRYGGTNILVVAAGESVEAAEKRLLVLIEAQERAWAGRKEAAPVRIRQGIRSTHEPVRRV